ncbi:hypothetical protein MMC18_002869 [Xylographa bjoerkii]|nr:hypothetical protein [Xylographa bjoerkii]
MDVFGDLIPSSTSDWCTTDLCWDSTLGPCTFPTGSEKLLDIAAWSEESQTSPTPELVQSEASTFDRFVGQLSTSAESAVSETAYGSDEVEVLSFKAEPNKSLRGLSLQADHGQEYGLTSPPQKARRRRRKVKQSLQDHWERHRSAIKHLYLDEEKCLEEVMHYMREHFGFSEKIPAYKRMLRQWGFSKNVPALQMSVLAAKARKRRAVEGKDTHFYVHERLLDPSKLIRFHRRKTAKDEDEDDVAAGAAMPRYIRYVTPPLDPSSSNKSPDLPDRNYSFSNNGSSVVQTPESFDMVYCRKENFLEDPLNDDSPLSSIELSDHVPKSTAISKYAFHIAQWEGPPYDELTTSLLPNVTDESVLENHSLLQAKAGKHTSLLVPRFLCGIFKPPVNMDTIPQQAPSKAVLGTASEFDQESLESRQQDSIPQIRNGRPSTVYSHDHLSRRQRESLSTTVAALEKVRDMILRQSGPKGEMFLQQSLGLGLMYQELEIPSKCAVVIADLANGYSRFWLPVDSSQWTEDDPDNASLPLSEYTYCAEPIAEHCSCDQLRGFAARNRARMSWRAFKALQSRAIACYLRSGRTGQALDSLLDLEDMFDPLTIEGYLQSVMEILDSYPIDDFNCNRLLPFLQRALPTGNNKGLRERLHRVSCQLWIAQKISLEAHLSLVTGSMKHHWQPEASNALTMVEDQLVHQVDNSNGNEFLTQIRIMRDVRMLTNFYEEQHGRGDIGQAFVLRIWEKCKGSWGLYNSETLQAQELVRGPYTGGLPQILLDPGVYDGAMVFERSFC